MTEHQADQIIQLLSILIGVDIGCFTALLIIMIFAIRGGIRGD